MTRLNLSMFAVTALVVMLLPAGQPAAQPGPITIGERTLPLNPESQSAKTALERLKAM